METPHKRNIRYFKQCLLFLVANLPFVAVGMGTIWPNVLSSTMAQGIPVTIHASDLLLSSSQTDMVGSMYFVGSLPGYLLAGYLVRRLGRRRSMLLAAIPGTLGAVCVALTSNAHLLLTGRFLEGVTYGMVTIAVRTYTVEVADTAIRGAAGVMATFMMQVGAVTCIGLSAVLAWYQLSFTPVAILLLFCLGVALALPESPTFLALTGQDDLARRVLRRLRGPDVEVEKVVNELKELNSGVGTGSWSFLRQWHVAKNILVVFGIFLISNMSGTEVVKANVSRILNSTALALNPELSVILFTSCLFAGNLTMMVVLDRLGRRRCLLASFVALTLAYGVLGAFSFLKESQQVSLEMLELASNSSTLVYRSNAPVGMVGWTWVPQACLMVAAFSQAFGSGPIPWILASEYFPTTIRSQAMCVCAVLASLQSFAALQLFTPLAHWLTEAGRYWTYSSTAALGIPYTLLVIRETRGKTVG